MKTKEETFESAIQLAYNQCFRLNGAKVSIPVGPHVVLAYGVGQNILRIDVKYAIRREWPPEEPETPHRIELPNGDSL